jgi:hypothetical protein
LVRRACPYDEPVCGICSYAEDEIFAQGGVVGVLKLLLVTVPQLDPVIRQMQWETT